MILKRQLSDSPTFLFMFTLNPNFLKIGYIILVATPKPAIRTLQQKAGYGESAKWTHVAGSLGG
ncbi:MAG: hypothetical protein COT38_05700 [Candidatus Omnitrophica bacterium CG08_land_8_20_14_0_20_41_16]|uniref:Uncharacterized protein n=1 Tax=Candidatus Sherwoodlollariibacterium unditelluris TaxID=1974757 RepID=A0A2G9YHR1_9BACT|nr:MAG: hypothetical protein COX41_06870 [Candidatus Omnitrophica bacterium CG23_combo_of_CG06-09_8_20_14_all_41_10]PIS33368.1 MAG: hypothetical protein COT38_05700 [Candidatus Omnitrophica bacterium CG08_land_8_20_14_0_20_41_16]